MLHGAVKGNNGYLLEMEKKLNMRPPCFLSTLRFQRTSFDHFVDKRINRSKHSGIHANSFRYIGDFEFPWFVVGGKLLYHN